MFVREEGLTSSVCCVVVLCIASNDKTEELGVMSEQAKTSWEFSTIEGAERVARKAAALTAEPDEAYEGLVELTRNAVVHGLEGERGSATLTVEHNPDDSVEFIVIDEGPGFELSEFLGRKAQRVGRGLARAFSCFHTVIVDRGYVAARWLPRS